MDKESPLSVVVDCAGLSVPEHRMARLGTYRGTSLIRNRPLPYDPPMTLGLGLLQGPRGGRFLMSQAPLHRDLITDDGYHLPSRAKQMVSFKVSGPAFKTL